MGLSLFDGTRCDLEKSHSVIHHKTENYARRHTRLRQRRSGHFNDAHIYLPLTEIYIINNEMNLFV